MTNDRTYNVLFLCHANSARSIMAECILQRLGQGRFNAHSAGNAPSGTLHPYALDLLRQQNFVVDGLRSKSWDEFAGPEAPKMDFVFTVCDDTANETCPVWPGAPIAAHWPIADPVSVPGTEAEKRFAFAESFRQLNTRISIFVNLPLRTIDDLALRQRLSDIGAQSHEIA